MANSVHVISASPLKAAPAVSFRTYDHITEGTYRGYCRAAEIYFDRRWRRWQAVLQFDVVGDSGFDVIARLTKFFPLGEGTRPRATSRLSKYYKAWVKANGGPPKRTDRMSPTIFRRRYARVSVVDVETDSDHVVMEENQRYSKIGEILNWETGALEERFAPLTRKPNNQLTKISMGKESKDNRL